jgi:hypothetical protein
MFDQFLVLSSKPMLDQFVGGIIVYVYLGYTLMILAKRLGHTNAWLSWIPIANWYLMTQMARQPWWWMLGFLIPFVNFFVFGFLWSEIGKRLGKPWWLGLLAVVPLIGLLLPGYFVITTKDHAEHHPHHPHA